ncbi:MAG: PhoH family protein [Gammaproteobacteria bacterium]|nr:PhoH family protein [Gammaproteobacteria bacterium]
MSKSLDTVTLTLSPSENPRLANLCGPFDQHLKQLEERLAVEIAHRGNLFNISGVLENVQAASKIIKNLYSVTRNEELTKELIHLHLQSSEVDSIKNGESEKSSNVVIHTRRSIIKPRGKNQERYVRHVLKNDLTFGIGPAGTGKTYLAVACAVEALDSEKVQKLVLVRPAVEAGERLGFLPGDLAQKIDPYLRPIYDALYEMMGFDRVNKLIEKTIIEVAPLAYMRGRTLNDAFVILDEAQNTTKDQMKMFLTRIGFGSKAVVTGDVTQIDLPNPRMSGLRNAIEVLNGVEKIKFNHFKSGDVVRHPLVKHIVEAYDDFDKSQHDKTPS